MDRKVVTLKPCISLSGFRSGVRQQLVQQILQLGGKVYGDEKFHTDCTHVVCGKPSRSEKFLGACVAGKWLVSKEFVTDSSKAGEWLPADKYEINSSMSHLLSEPNLAYLLLAPQRWRLKIQKSGQRAFTGWRTAVMVDSHQKATVYKRLLKCGGAQVFDIKLASPGTDKRLTHIFVDEGMKMEVAALRPSVATCFTPLYIGEYLLKHPPPDPSEFVVKLPGDNGLEPTMTEDSHIGTQEGKKANSGVNQFGRKRASKSSSTRSSQEEKLQDMANSFSSQESGIRLTRSKVSQTSNGVKIKKPSSTPGRVEKRTTGQNLLQENNRNTRQNLSLGNNCKFDRETRPQESHPRTATRQNLVENGQTVAGNTSSQESSGKRVTRQSLSLDNVEKNAMEQSLSQEKRRKKTTKQCLVPDDGGIRTTRQSLSQESNGNSFTRPNLSQESSGRVTRQTLSEKGKKEDLIPKCSLRQQTIVSLLKAKLGPMQSPANKSFIFPGPSTDSFGRTPGTHSAPSSTKGSPDKTGNRVEARVLVKRLSVEDLTAYSRGTINRSTLPHTISLSQGYERDISAKKVQRILCQERLQSLASSQTSLHKELKNQAQQVVRSTTVTDTRFENFENRRPVVELPKSGSLTNTQSQNMKGFKLTGRDTVNLFVRNTRSQRQGNGLTQEPKDNERTDQVKHLENSEVDEPSSSHTILRPTAGQKNVDTELVSCRRSTRLAMRGQEDSKVCMGENVASIQENQKVGKQEAAATKISTTGMGGKLDVESKDKCSNSKRKWPVDSCQECTVPSAKKMKTSRGTAWMPTSLCNLGQSLYTESKSLGAVASELGDTHTGIFECCVDEEHYKQALDVVMATVSRSRYPQPRTLATIMTAVLKESGDNLLSKKAFSVLQHVLMIHPPKTPALQAMYRQALSAANTNPDNNTQEWTFVKDVISFVVEGECEGVEDQHQENQRLLLRYLVSLLEADFSNFLLRHQSNGGQKRHIQPSLLAILLWPDPRQQGTVNAYCRQLLILFSETIHYATSSQDRHWLQLLTLMQSLVSMAAQCCYLMDGSQINNIGEKASLFSQDLAHRMQGIEAEDVFETVLSTTQPAWLRVEVCRTLLDLYDHSLLPPAMSDQFSLQSINGKQQQSKEHQAKTRREKPAPIKTITKRQQAMINKKNLRGETALHTACIKNQVAKVKELLSIPGIDVNAQDHVGWTPLHEACNHGHVECVRELLQYRPAKTIDSYFQTGNKEDGRLEPLKANEEGITPLHDAILSNHIEVVRLLLHYGGDKLLKPKTVLGYTPLDLAITDEMVTLLNTPLEQLMTAPKSYRLDDSQNCSQSQSLCSQYADDEYTPTEEVYLEVLGHGAMQKKVSQEECSRFVCLLVYLVQSYITCHLYPLNGGLQAPDKKEEKGYSENAVEDLAILRDWRHRIHSLQSHVSRISISGNTDFCASKLGLLKLLALPAQ